MNYQEWIQGVEDAQRIMRMADDVTETMANALIGRLRKARGSTLKMLKKELQDFNMQTYTWKEER